MYRSNLNRHTKKVTIDSFTTNIQDKKKNGVLLKRRFMKDFLENTSLNGLKFVGLTQITLFERYLSKG